MGNQLFQYAAARALAVRLGVDVALDPRLAPSKGFRLGLQHFDICTVPPVELPPMRSDSVFRYGAWRVFGKNPKMRRERGLGFNSAFTAWGDNSYLHGYWQTDRYFADIQGQIRQDLRMITSSTKQNDKMAARIQKAQSVSLHVRRGDYLGLAAHQVCTEKYYRNAVATMAEKKGIDPTVFVFSDDPDWAKDNLDLPCEKVVVDFNGPEADFEDLRLMSLCQHNIIANSSFSWWGAWRNENRDKIVIAPDRWFGKGPLHNPDIIPQSWLRVPG